MIDVTGDEARLVHGGERRATLAAACTQEAEVGAGEC